MPDKCMLDMPVKETSAVRSSDTLVVLLGSFPGT